MSPKKIPPSKADSQKRPSMPDLTFALFDQDQVSELVDNLLADPAKLN